MYYANYRQLASSTPPYPKTSALGNDYAYYPSDMSSVSSPPYPNGPNCQSASFSSPTTVTYTSLDPTIFNAHFTPLGASSPSFETLTREWRDSLMLLGSNATVGSCSIVNATTGYSETSIIKNDFFNVYQASSVSTFWVTDSLYAQRLTMGPGGPADAARRTHGIMRVSDGELTFGSKVAVWPDSWSTVLSVYNCPPNTESVILITCDPLVKIELPDTLASTTTSWPGGLAYGLPYPWESMTAASLAISYVPPIDPPQPPNGVGGNDSDNPIFQSHAGAPPETTGSNYQNVVNIHGPIRNYVFQIRMKRSPR